MQQDDLTGLLDRLVLAGVAITSRALTEALPDLELTFPQWRVLLVVGEEAEGATVSEVSNRVGVTVPATSRQLRRLAGRGLLEIRRDDRDRRAARARLTSRGVAVRDAILAYRRARIGEVAGALRVSAPTVRELVRVVDAFDAYR
jgi:DNA-binding MarR family transcriptional regulator